MRYYILTESNCGTLDFIKSDTIEKAKLSEHKYYSASIVFIGEELFDRIAEKEGIEVRYREKVARIKGSSPSVEQHTAVYVRFYADMRENRTGFGDVSFGLVLCMNGVYLRPSNYRTKTTYSFSLLNEDRDYYHRLPSYWEKENPAPNNVGMITDKKVLAWVEWLTARADKYDHIVAEEDNKVKNFLNRLNNLDYPFTEKVIGDTKGRLVMNNLKFSYEISKGYISTSIDIDRRYGRDDDMLSNFLYMATGRYDK